MTGTGLWTTPVPKHAAKTFHGRDVFLPAAIELSRGEFEAIQLVSNVDHLVDALVIQ